MLVKLSIQDPKDELLIYDAKILNLKFKIQNICNYQFITHILNKINGNLTKVEEIFIAIFLKGNYRFSTQKMV